MKKLKIAAAAVLAFCAFISLEAHADSKGIAVLAVDNQAELSDADTSTLFRIVEAPFKALPAAQYRVGTLNPVSEGESPPCDEACMVSNAGTAGADFAVYTTVSTLGGRTMATLKLYDAKTGRLMARRLTDPLEDIAGLAAPVDQAAQKLAQALLRLTPSSVSRPRRPAPPPRAPKAFPLLRSQDGILHVSSDPPGASVAVGGRLGQRFIGVTPLTENLIPHRYRVVISKDGYTDEQRDVHIYPGKARSIHVELYSSKRLIQAGHFVFWPGIVALIPSAALAATNHRGGAIAVSIAAGTLVTAGTVLLITGAIRLRKEKKERQRHRMASTLQASVLPAEAIYF